MAPDLPAPTPRSVAQLTHELMKRSHDMFASSSTEQRGVFIDEDRCARNRGGAAHPARRRRFVITYLPAAGPAAAAAAPALLPQRTREASLQGA